MRVTYAAPGVCPTESEFGERVRSRVQRARFAEPGELARAFDVTVSVAPAEPSFLGHLEFIAADGQRAERNVAGATCDELVSSLALITALAIDDRAPEPEPTEMPPLPSPPPLAESTPPKKANPSLGASPREAEPATAHARRVRWDVGLSAGALTWLTRDAEPSFGLFVAASPYESSWSLRLSAFDARQTRQVKRGSAEFSADFAADWLRLEACPVAFSFSPHVSLAPCVAFDGGVLRATSVESAGIAHGNQGIFWAAGVALLRLGWEVDRRWVLGLDGELGVPFVRQIFQFRDPDIELLETPKIGGGAKFSVGLRFP